jgi:hypothetical protein
VASELCKRGYEVALTLGNDQAIDLMVISPNDKHFDIDAKGLYKPAFWGVQPQPAHQDLCSGQGLFFVIVI